MTKAKISEYDAVAANNTDVNGVNIAENCPPSGMNNMGREIMAALKRFQVGSDSDGVTVGGNLVVSGTSTLSTTSISSADINAGTIDGTAIGGSTPAAGSFTTLNTSGQVVFNDAGADVDFRVEGDTDANLLFVDASADAVLIGTNTQIHAAKLTVNKTGGVNTTILGWTDSANSTGKLSIRTGGVVGIGSDGILAFSTGEAGADTFTERMRITSAGDMVVSSDLGGANLFKVINSSSTGYGISVEVNNNSSSTYRYFEGVDNGPTQRIAIYTNGDVKNTNNSYGALSDLKLKQDISDAGSQWDDIKSLRIRKYRFKDNADGPFQLGVIAQELESVSPGLVVDHPDEERVTRTREVEKTRVVTEAVLDEDGNEIEPAVTETYTEEEEYTERVMLDTTTKSVKYSILYMKAVKALQEAMERIETLEAKVAALENA